MEISKHDWTLSGTATSLQLFSLNRFPITKSFQFMNFSQAMFYENYLTSDSFIKTLLFQTSLPTRQNGVKNRDRAYS